MSYLLDTNVLSELARSRPDPRVVAWFQEAPDPALHVSVLTLGEIRRGVEVLRDESRRERLRTWLEVELVDWFGLRLLPVSAGVADRWGRLLAEVQRSVPAIDSLLAATALHHQLRVVTRNVKHFRFPGLEVINPWGDF
ncbi:MAG TPA: type II toxin-antitoxin system VapC family toxin [Thermoanaerobaculia bacterium]|nr:type II toxin-antitoxin system VapC family toxin [Thermoanaerobaculia bacterium]